VPQAEPGQPGSPGRQPGTGPRRRIAVVGSGVAGLTAAYILSRTAAVTLFEADGRLGGHADTHQVTGPDGRELAVDTGFIVHNKRTYPLLTRLFTELGVTTQPSEMSMSVSCAGCGLEYAGQRGLGGLLAGLPRGRVRYLGMLGEVLRFHRAARRLLAAAGSDGTAPDGTRPAGTRPDRAGDTEQTLAQFLATGHFSQYFTVHFALPVVASVWSCSAETALSYPARYLFAFLDQHGLLAVTGSPPWLTVTGGSRSYVNLVAKQLTTVRTGARVMAVRRATRGAEVSWHSPGGGRSERFDGVVLAAHPGQALALLAEPTAAELSVLGAFRYSPNPAVLHTDASVLPASPRALASWNYALPSCSVTPGQVQVSYSMNRLQRLPGDREYVVTLNGGDRIAPDKVLARMDYEHPIYDPGSVAAQRRLPALNDGVLAFAGAYHGWGFHEDGCRSGVAAAASLGGQW